MFKKKEKKEKEEERIKKLKEDIKKAEEVLKKKEIDLPPLPQKTEEKDSLTITPMPEEEEAPQLPPEPPKEQVVGTAELKEEVTPTTDEVKAEEIIQDIYTQLKLVGEELQRINKEKKIIDTEIESLKTNIVWIQQYITNALKATEAKE